MNELVNWTNERTWMFQWTNEEWRYQYSRLPRNNSVNKSIAN